MGRTRAGSAENWKVVEERTDWLRASNNKLTNDKSVKIRLKKDKREWASRIVLEIEQVTSKGRTHES